MATVETVTGRVAFTELGVTLPHEHAFLDLTCLWHAPRQPERAWLVDALVHPALFETLRSDPYHCLDNLRLNDAAIVRNELLRFREAGGRTVVDLSTSTIGPYPEELRALSLATGLQIVMGTGFYIHQAHPEWIQDAPWQHLSDHMLRDVTEGFPGTSIRAGILGELGTTSPVHPDEMKVLRAAVAVQRQHPMAMNIHLSIFAQEGLPVLDALESYGADLSRVALSHLDENLDPAYHRALAQRGAFLEFDTWGSECRFDDEGLQEPTDAERLIALQRLADQGHLHQLLLSQDVCTKMHWRTNGGRGYDHILRSIVPRLRISGFSEDEIYQLTVINPARLLGGEAPDQSADHKIPAPERQSS